MKLPVNGSVGETVDGDRTIYRDGPKVGGISNLK